ncbi:MAG: putative baseplate assembly protein [Gammaproteobacteria bacterium]|nr:putative baseplate assembly protein [Gammaproteobacteria bacterium]MDH5651345.1 putative baseplate assembly protein [Gammaproteobacteria bacterium]
MAIQYICNNPQRKSRIREIDSGKIRNGIDFLEVDTATQKILTIYFVKDDANGDLAALDKENIRIDGGTRIKNIKVKSLEAHPGGKKNILKVVLENVGDYSIYTLRIVSGIGVTTAPEWLDPILAVVEFSFKVGCTNEFDCKQDQECPEPEHTEPEIDYLAKDYASFRQLMLDRMANIVPAWKERNPSDLGMAVVEILAYAGDHLSYYQDAIATEAYLDTARRRVSTRRHARLLDYQMHEGSNARTWVVLEADDVSDGYIVPKHAPLLTNGPRPDVKELDLTPKSNIEPIYNADFEDFVFLAEEFVALRGAVSIEAGHIGANEMFVNRNKSTHKHKGKTDHKHDYSVEIDAGANMLSTESVAFGDTVRIENNARVSNVAYHTELVNEGTITRREYDDIKFPLFHDDDLPVVPDFEPGEDDIEVEEHGELNLLPGSYGNLKIGQHAKVNFTGGTYNFLSLVAERYVKLIFKKDTEIRILKKLDTNDDVRINQDEDDVEAGRHKVTIFFKGKTHSRQYAEIELGQDNVINAHLYAPKTFVRIRERVNATGVFFARKIIVAEGGVFRNIAAEDSLKALTDLRFCIQNLEPGMHVFETMYPTTLYKNHNRIEFYTWGDDDCCLPRGATRASFYNEADRLQNLKKGDVLLFEEIMGVSGYKADRDMNHKHAVRITKITADTDPLYEEAEPYFVNNVPQTALRILNIEWSLEDALPFPLCLRAVIPQENGTSQSAMIGVARGNVVLADHGRTICRETLQPDIVPATDTLFRPYLSRLEVTHHQLFNYTQAEDKPAANPASGLLLQDPRKCVPDIFLEAGNSEIWEPQRDLLGSNRFATEFVVEMEDDGRAFLRFGDSVLGKRPAPGLTLDATYRVGNGGEGNIGQESIKTLILPKADADTESHITVRNPMAAQGGVDPEPIEQVRLYAPQAFRTQKRAVTTGDYAAMAESHPEVQKAVANQRWTGSWHTVFITVDRMGGLEVDSDFEKKIRDYLEPFRMMGHELEIEAPRQVALEAAFRVCVKREFLKSKVKEALLEAFSTRRLSAGRLGFFHPDNFTFGQSVYLSRMIATAMQVAGVTWVDPITFKRWGAPDKEWEDIEELEMGRLEIARLDNDPNAPENGKIEFIMEGGL